MELFESESVKQKARTDRAFLENIQQYVAKMLKDKNQVNFAKCNGCFHPRFEMRLVSAEQF